ncbi:MAG: SDR family oxidoreductase [bacterium]
MIKNRLLITGGSGFVGGHLINLAQSEWDVWTTWNTHPISMKGVRSVNLDISSEKAIEDLVDKLQPQVIIHTAAWSDLEKCEKNPEQAFRINTTATEVFAEISVKAGIRFLFISSDMVFDGKKGNYKETDTTNPINIYGKTKLTAEKFVKAICTNYVIARSALIYGPPLTGSNSFSEKILEKLSAGEIMPLFRDQFRSPILVQNLAQALLELARCDFCGIIHLGGIERTDRYTFGTCLAEIKGFSEDLLKPVSMSSIKTQAPRPQDTSFDISKARRLLSTNFIGIKQGLREF